MTALPGSLACVLAALAVVGAVVSVRDWLRARREFEDALLRRGFRKATRLGWVKHMGERE
jgi:hypothetical protein